MVSSVTVQSTVSPNAKKTGHNVWPDLGEYRPDGTQVARTIGQRITTG
jgi:hypothetical protein